MNGAVTYDLLKRLGALTACRDTQLVDNRAGWHIIVYLQLTSAGCCLLWLEVEAYPGHQSPGRPQRHGVREVVAVVICCGPEAV
jgi:hypothetical protein